MLRGCTSPFSSLSYSDCGAVMVASCTRPPRRFCTVAAGYSHKFIQSKTVSLRTSMGDPMHVRRSSGPHTGLKQHGVQNGKSELHLVLHEHLRVATLLLGLLAEELRDACPSNASLMSAPPSPSASKAQQCMPAEVHATVMTGSMRNCTMLADPCSFAKESRSATLPSRTDAAAKSLSATQQGGVQIPGQWSLPGKPTLSRAKNA